MSQRLCHIDYVTFFDLTKNCDVTIADASKNYVISYH